MLAGGAAASVCDITISMLRVSLLLGVLAIVILGGVTEVRTSGRFELQLLALANARGELHDGRCCEDPRPGNFEGDREGGQPVPCEASLCKTFFHLCLKELKRTRASDMDDCTFGNMTSSVTTANSYHFDAPSFVFSFDFAWPRAFTLVLEARHLSDLGVSYLIDRAHYSGVILPGGDWHVLTYSGTTATFVYKIRLVCENHYFNTTCTKFCMARNDKFGHYTCDSNGDKICMDGWMGTNCEMAQCRTGCHPIHGSCDRPGQCRCAFGWKGLTCDRCNPYPGCAHGTCVDSPWQCICDVNWGGILCDKDLNYCGSHTPCLNGGTCKNQAPNDYACDCPLGYQGKNCETATNPCASHPCKNGAICQTVGGGRIHCTCLAGWSGTYCDTGVDECLSNPCQHGGVCVDAVAGYQCQCPDSWHGAQCQLPADQCLHSPCLNALSCRNLQGEPTCRCQPGYAGTFCEINVDDCHGQCRNGGTCVDLVDGFTCVCEESYAGRYCEKNVAGCSSSPCLNDGLCFDLAEGYKCVCLGGYSGKRCEIDSDPCDPDPCLNGGSCYPMSGGDIYCQCPDDYQGKFCTSKKTHCQLHLCNEVNACLVPVAFNDTLNRYEQVETDVCGAHGRCVSDEDGGFSCRCEPGYTGIFCRDGVNECASNPCQNQGTCIRLHGQGYQCICTDGWEGTNCQLNQDDCSPNPCRNNAMCIDHVADFTCQCPQPWIGRLCNLRVSQCDDVTCMNGGTCIDIGDTFSCQCTADWHGRTCHLATVQGCQSLPCQHGGTCVGAGSGFTCLCRDGYEGALCEHDVNDCNPAPCYNGARCIDGVNSYRCECPVGFLGPDCRININECQSNPCAYGSTCVDEIGSFRCVCPSGRAGIYCQLVTQYNPRPHDCQVEGHVYANGAEWDVQCNKCTCRAGRVLCSQVWCGPENCLMSVNMTEPLGVCAGDEVCVTQSSPPCFTSRCLPWGQCQRPGGSDAANTLPPRHLNNVTSIHQHSQQCDSDSETAPCGSVTLVFDKRRMPVGISVEAICSSVRRLTAVQDFSRIYEVVMFCDIDDSITDAIRVSIMTSSDGRQVSVANSNTAISLREFVQQVTDTVASTIARRVTNKTLLDAVVEVKIYTIHTAEVRPLQAGVMLVPVLCSILGVCGVLAAIGLVVWHNRRLQLLVVANQKRRGVTDVSREAVLDAREVITESLLARTRHPNPTYAGSSSAASQFSDVSTDSERRAYTVSMSRSLHRQTRERRLLSAETSGESGFVSDGRPSPVHFGT